MIAPIRLYCDMHDAYVGNPYPPRCPLCEQLTAEYNALPPLRHGYAVGIIPAPEGQDY
jgi:hypothetical protein